MTEYIYGTDGHEGHWLTGEEIVRCRDCRHGHETKWPKSWNIPADYLDCTGELVETWDYWNDQPNSNPVKPDGFCAWGERRPTWRELENSDQYAAAAHALDTTNHNTCFERGE